VVVGSTVVPAVAAAPAASDATLLDDDEDDNPCVGTMEEPANGMTVVSVQGWNRNGQDQPRVVGIGPEGEIQWVHRNGDGMGARWSYDIDPMGNGYLFVVATYTRGDVGKTAMYKLDARTGEVVWLEEVDLHDTHDADILEDGRIVIANMRAYDEESGVNEAGLKIYNRTTGEFEWEWQFADHYDRSVGGTYEEDWTHLNDVDRVGDDKFIASPRNFDQVVLINQTTGEIELTLGEDGSSELIERQHQPDYLESEDGNPTFLIADSDNDRVIEYEHTDDGWENTWTLEGDMRWTRDADRLPDGNTLVTDTVNDRVLEVRPDGEVVWELYTPYHVYEAERVEFGDESVGETTADMNETGTVELHGHEDFSETEIAACEQYLDALDPQWAGRDDDSTSTDDTDDGTTTGTPDLPQLGDGTTTAADTGGNGGDGGDGGAGLPTAGVAAAVAGLVVALLAKRRRGQ